MTQDVGLKTQVLSLNTENTECIEVIDRIQGVDCRESIPQSMKIIKPIIINRL